ncbi:MAG TPA: glycoside hydrolase family 172 protein [Acidobacteriaceae bacterium]
MNQRVSGWIGFKALLVGIVFFCGLSLLGQNTVEHPNLTQMQDYRAHRSSSSDPAGGNADYRDVVAGGILTLLDTDGPGTVTHMWFTLSPGSQEDFYMKKIVLRMYWDNEAEPSVEMTLGDFFGEHFGDLRPWSSEMLSVGPDRALNSFFPMPFRKHARITLTNEGKQMIKHIYFNLDYVIHNKPLHADTLYFHAAFTQQQPTHGWTDDWKNNRDAGKKPNLDGKGNFNWLEATGRGQYVGVVLSVLQNQEGWWGEGDDMFFVDGEKTPSVAGTGSEDYFLGAFDFWPGNYTEPQFGIFRMGDEHIGSRYTMYRFHLEEPIPFTRSLIAGIEHGSANHRSDNYYATAYWYQALPHALLPPLLSIMDRMPAVQLVGGPGVATPVKIEPQSPNKQ